MDNLPRGIYYTSLRQPGRSANQGKAVSSIPGFIQSQYEKTKLPALRPGLAGESTRIWIKFRTQWIQRIWPISEIF